MSLVEEKHPTETFYWGTISGAICSILSPYKKGKKLDLTKSDLQYIDKGKEFIKCVLEGFDIIDNPKLLFEKNDDISRPSLVEMVFDISLHEYSDPNMLREDLKSYSRILDKVEDNKVTSADKENIIKAYSFFSKLSEKADSEMADFYFPRFASAQ